MKPNLEHQLQMVWRTENPNYIILVKNKAGKHMDFSQFKPIQTKLETEKKERVYKYELKITPYLGVMLLVRVLDLEDKNKEVLRVEVKEEKKQAWISKVKEQYKLLKYDS